MPSGRICELFKRRSKWTWNSIESRLPYGLIDEQTATNENLAEIQQRSGGYVRVRKFSQQIEGRLTGADWEWFFVGDGGFLRCRVQAKMINQALQYPHLDRRAAATAHLPPNALQVDLLISDALREGAIPLYCFYNYWAPVSGLAPTWGCQCVGTAHELMGCAIVDAFTVKRLIAAGVQDAGTVMGHAFPWHCLVCCSDPTLVGAASEGFAERAAGFLAGRLADYPFPNNFPREGRLHAPATLPQYVKEMIIGEGKAIEDIAPPASYVMAVLDRRPP